MVTFILRRARDLSMPEISRLPNGCVAVSGSSDIVARAQVDLPIGRLVALAVSMARSIPDARFEVNDGSDGSQLFQVPPISYSALPSLPVPQKKGAADSTSADGSTEAPRVASGNPWSLIEAGKVEDAERIFAHTSLDSHGRDQVRLLLRSTDPAQVALACRIARLTKWRSLVHNLRALVRHADVRVRQDAVQAIGVLAGPALEPAIRPLLEDPSPEVQAAAIAAIAALTGR